MMSLELAGQNGLVLRGAFVPEKDDAVPRVMDRPAGALLLFGNAGSSIWTSFSASAEYHDGAPDPLNRWSKRLGSELAAASGGVALFPFGGPPYQPFLRWAARAESLQSSALGLMMHSEYGLWHAYRFAIALPHWPDDLDLPAPANNRHACDRCEEKPCLSRCPVGAFSTSGYDVARCYQYLDENLEAPCHQTGCLARGACPEGTSFRYLPDHASFHMEKFYQSLQVRFGS